MKRLMLLCSLFAGFVAWGVVAPASSAENPNPTVANLAYAAPEPAQSRGHLLDLYLPAPARKAMPVVIWTGGSAWMSDDGKSTAGAVAAHLNPSGFVVVGVSVRSSAQAVFPAQLYDIKAAIRWIRANADRFGLDPDRIGIMGDSSGGWTAAMAAMTGEVPALDGEVGTRGVSSRVRAAVAFYPPTDFLAMDGWAPRKCDPAATPGPDVSFCHGNGGSPESLLIGCALTSCPDKVSLANPARYVTDRSPPMMIVHGQSDPLVPHNQGELLYQALNKHCRDAVFISLPRGGHGNLQRFLADDATREGATIRSTTAVACAVSNPAPVTPTWDTVIAFLNQHLRN